MIIVAYLEVPDEAVNDGWFGDVDELKASVRATLHELVGDDGNVYIPTVTFEGAS